MAESNQNLRIAPITNQSGESDFLDSVLSSAMDAILIIDESHKIILFNLAAEKMFGYSASEVIGQALGVLLPFRFRNRHTMQVAGFGETNATKRRMGNLGVVYGLRKNGEEFPVETSISSVYKNGKVYFTAILRDITERQRTEAILREQVELLNHARDAIIVFSLNDEVLFWNRSAERIFGFSASECLGKRAADFVCPDDPGKFQGAKESTLIDGDWFGEVDFVSPKNEKRVVEGRWSIVHDGDENPVLILAICTDITEKKRFETQFLRSQRLESIGILAGGIAHDLNNILSPIMMSIALLEAKHSDPESTELLNTLLLMTERGGDMVKQILAFARGVEGEKITLSPRILVKEIVKILRETFPKDITIHQELDDELENISGDITQLHQVLMNLAVNARDAMPDGGTLTFVARNVEIDSQYARMNVDAETGPFVLIQLIDTGCGIPSKMIHKIFDPFFTTKEKGKGTGLGLSTSVNIIRSHKGFINVYSEPGQGTRFDLYLPALRGIGENESAVELSLPRGNGELILLIDDEAAITEVTGKTLEIFGYRVEKASNGAEGIEKFKARREEIRLIITDLMMPVLNGAETIREIRRIQPDAKIIASSGLESGKKREATTLGASLFISKPYTAKTLLESIKSVLKSDSN